MLCTIYHRGPRYPTRLAVLDMLIVHILPWKLLVTTLAVKTLSKVDGHDMAVNRVFEHRFGAPVPQTLSCALHTFPPGVPFADVSADTGSGGDDPHPAGVVGRGPSAFMDVDHAATAVCAKV